MVPGPDPEPWPTLGPQICDFIEERAVYGPGSLQGQPYVIDPEFRAFIYRASEVYPQGHQWAGRRRFKRVGLSVRKGLAKTEKEALLVYTHVHPEGPGRCDGFDAYGNPVAAPVRAPYVPMLAYSLDQVEELAYGALKYIIENGPDGDMFDVSLERALRLDEFGRADGGAWPLAQSPDARDGGRTTLNAFDEPHRLYLPRHLKAHETMDANLPKRPLDDPWSLYVGTAGKLGQGSVAEQQHTEALQISKGLIERPDLFYLYRTDDDPKRDLSVKAERLKAVAEATGPAGEWGPGQFDDIASKWDRPGADKPYLERVWLNRWVKHREQAFDAGRIDDLAQPGVLVPSKAFVSGGFDGARFRDSTGVVITDIETGLQQLIGHWERPESDLIDPDEDWEVPEVEVTATVEHMRENWRLWKMYGDPPYWTETMGSWAGRWPDQIEEWWTARPKPMAYALREYVEALDSGSLRFGGTADAPDGTEGSCSALVRHLKDAGRRDLSILDERGKPLWVLSKQDGNEDLKFDFAMASVLSWKACLDARKSGAKPPSSTTAVPIRVR